MLLKDLLVSCRLYLLSHSIVVESLTVVSGFPLSLSIKKPNFAAKDNTCPTRLPYYLHLVSVPVGKRSSSTESYFISSHGKISKLDTNKLF